MATPIEAKPTDPGRSSINLFNAMSGGAVRVVSLAATVLMPVTATRLLTPSEVANVMVGLSVATILGVVAPLGLPWSISIAVAQLRASGDGLGSLQALLRLAYTHLTVVFVLLVAGSYLVSRWWTGATASVVAIVCAIGVLRAASRTLSEVNRGFGRVTSAAVTTDLLGPAIGLALIGVIAAVGPAFNSYRFLLPLSAGWIVAALAALVTSPVRPGPTRPSAARPWEAGIAAFALVAVLNIGIQQFHILLAGTLFADLDAAQFSTAARLATLTGTPLMIIAGIASPDIGLALQSDDEVLRRVIEQRLQRLTGLLFLPAATLTVVYAALGGPILKITFGPEYQTANVELALLALGPLASLFAGTAGLALSLAGRHRTLLLLTFTGASVAVMAMVAGAALLGTRGLAAGYSTGQIVINWLLVTACRTQLAFDPSARLASPRKLCLTLPRQRGAAR